MRRSLVLATRDLHFLASAIHVRSWCQDVAVASTVLSLVRVRWRDSIVPDATSIATLTPIGSLVVIVRLRRVGWLQCLFLAAVGL